MKRILLAQGDDLTLYRLLMNKDYETLMSRIGARFDVDFDAERLRKVLNTTPLFIPTHGTDDCFVMWLKNRLVEIGAFKNGFGEKAFIPDVVTATLHIAFLYIEETEEMLARLPEKGQTKEAVAQSKVFQTTKIIHPIDRVAARVAAEKEVTHASS